MENNIDNAGNENGEETPVVGSSSPTVEDSSNDAGGAQNDGNTTQQSAVEKKWYDELPDELKGNPNVTKFKDVGALSKSYVEAVRKLGQKGIMPLADDATPEQREAYNSMRRGESIKSPDDYSFEKDNQDEQIKAIKKTLFDAGADDYMAKEVLSKLDNFMKADESAAQAHAEQVYAKEAEKLRSEWGENYAVNVKANDILLSKYPEAERVLKSLGADKCYGVAMMLNRLNAMASDGQIKFEQAREKSFKERLSEIGNSDAYKQAWHPDHEKAKQARADLIMKMANKS